MFLFFEVATSFTTIEEHTNVRIGIPLEAIRRPENCYLASGRSDVIDER
jgi:hypothetical protein